ncbi:hypothetical protein JCM14720_23350 [Calditerricola yamamurae]
MDKRFLQHIFRILGMAEDGIHESVQFISVPVDQQSVLLPVAVEDCLDEPVLANVLLPPSPLTIDDGECCHPCTEAEG